MIITSTLYFKKGTKKVLVLINPGNYNVKQTITFQDVSAATVVPYVTTTLKNVEQGSAVTVTNNSFVYSLPAKSIVTFVEQ